jgi:hypothetical protein
VLQDPATTVAHSYPSDYAGNPSKEKVMRKLLTVASALVLFGTASLAQADSLSFNINVGGPPIVISQPPDFIYPSELGFGVAVGVPYDMFYDSGIYYVYRGGGWYRTSAYGGSWVRIGQRQLPPQLRRYNINKIHAFRDREYRTFSRDREHYRGKRFNPAGERREERHEMKEQRQEIKEQRHDMKEQRHEMKEQRHEMKEQRHEDRQDQHEQRRDERGGERRDERH